MDPTDLLPLLEQLDDNVDDLEGVLQPLLASTLLKNSNKLPVMDKAKLHVLITYTLESLIFCTSQHKIPAFGYTNKIGQLICGFMAWMRSSTRCSGN